MTKKNKPMIGNQDNFVGAGFKRIDPKALGLNPPKINWGVIYKNKTDEEKIRYLEKFAASMNHAASLIQKERNELGKLCELKEAQLLKLGKAVAVNNAMLQSEVTKMNEQRQGYNAHVAELNAEIRGLKNNA